MLSLQPDAFLLAVGIKGKPATAVFTMYNTTCDTVAYKIKANYADAVSIDSPRKAMSPLSCIDITLSVELDKPDLMIKIVSTVLPASGILTWKQAHRQVLRVRVLSVPEQTVTLPWMKMQGSLSDTQAKVAELQLSTAGLMSEVEAVRQLVAGKKGKRKAAEVASAEFIHELLSFVVGLCVAYLVSCLPAYKLA